MRMNFPANIYGGIVESLADDFRNEQGGSEGDFCS